MLTGSAFGAAVAGPYQSVAASGCGHLFIALDIAAFMLPAEFGERVQRLVAELKGTPLAAGSDEVLVPGELEARHARRHERDGIALPARTRVDLNALAAELGVAPLV